MEELISRTSEVFNLPKENMEVKGERTFMAHVSGTWIKALKKSGNSDLIKFLNCDKSDFETDANVKEIQISQKKTEVEVIITVLDLSKCNFSVSNLQDTTEKCYKKSLYATIEKVALTHKRASHKQFVKDNLNCYCVLNEEKDKTVFREMEPMQFFRAIYGDDIIIHNIGHKNTAIEEHGNTLSELTEEEPREGKPSEMKSAENTSFCKDKPNGNTDIKFASKEVDKVGETDQKSENFRTSHVNLKTPIAVVLKDGIGYIVTPTPRFTVQDALYYSPAFLPNDDTKTLFVLYQMVQFFANYEEFFHRDLSSVQWSDVEIDEKGWVKVILPESTFFSLKNNDGERECDDAKRDRDGQELKRLPDVLDKWIAGQLSNYDYLMYLNKLAGRSEKDPNHHPILPWVSTLENENSWRDLKKSKYRINKGDRQLDLQYEMMLGSADVKDLNQVPHHVPEFLSDITYYVYMARRTSKDILCKLVRSYWEPNEYPGSIQRMQEWTPDECIPEFYTDPSVFKSQHEDMTDLAVPEWCRDAEDFIKKHKQMLESDEVSCDLHHWIDVTFGYKLSGKECVIAKNVCLPLVDRHAVLRKRGVTQLFDVPHPKRRCKSKHRDIDMKPEVIDGELQISASFDPRQELRELEKLLTFKANIWNSMSSSPSLFSSLEKSRCQILAHDSEKTAISDRNVIALVCLMIELHTLVLNKDLLLYERFRTCVQCFKVRKSVLPPGIKCAVQYFLNNLQNSEAETYDLLQKSLEPGAYTSIFKTVSERGISTPSASLLCSPYIHILPFPDHMHQVYEVLEIILIGTKHYSQPLPEVMLPEVCDALGRLFDSVIDTEECLDLITLHIRELYKQPTAIQTFEIVANAMGPKKTKEDIFPLVLKLYESSLKDGSANSTNEALYSKQFILQLSMRLGLKPFLDHIPSCLSDALIAGSETIADISQHSIYWLMERIGPTLTSKYIVRHLFRVLNNCFLINEGPSVEICAGCHERVLDCLIHASELFGPSIITLQYFAHLIHNISSSVYHPKFAARHQAAVEASVAAVTHFIKFLTDVILMEQLTRISKEMIIPVIGLLGKKNLSFYGGSETRKSLCLNLIHLMALIVIRIGREMSREHLTHLFKNFFSHFQNQESAPTHQQTSTKLDKSVSPAESDGLQIGRGFATKAIKIGERSPQDTIHGTSRQLHKSWFNDSPTPSPTKGLPLVHSDNNTTDPSLEVAATFCAETAYCSYVAFTRLLGDIHIGRILGKDHDRIWNLSLQHEKTLNGEESVTTSQPSLVRNNYQSDITMVGNRLIVAPQSEEIEANPTLENDFDIMTTLLTSSGGIHTEDKLGESVRLNLKVFPSTQLTENWLAYWEHEIGLPENDKHIHFNQIELQAFIGHSSAVRSLACHPSEEWFVSGGKDKTVKIWSLWENMADEGKDDKTDTFAPVYTYKSHKKTVNYVGITESEQMVISNDGNVHVWDPYTCQQVLAFDSSDVKSGFALVATMPAPNRYALTVTNEGDLRFIDFRRKCLAHEFKSVFGNSFGIARAICVSSDANSAMIGFSTGMVSILDIRVGTLLSLKPTHEGDITTMATISDNQFLTASADQTVAIWEVGRSNSVATYKTFQEPVHTVEIYNDEFISASVANRVAVHALPNGDAKSVSNPLAVSKLRSDSFRGVLSTFCVLPMKRQLLLGSDNGTVKLMA